MPLPSIDKLALGYNFDRDREIVFLILFSYFYILLFTGIAILLHTKGEEDLIFVTYRYHALILLGIVDLLLVRNKCFTAAKVLMLTLTPFLLIILPSLAGLTDNEFYFWFPYVPIAISLIPHFILHPFRNRTALWITLGIYFLLAVFIYEYMYLLKDGSETIIDIIEANQFYYQLVPVVIYLFVNLALGMVFAENYRYGQVMAKQQDELIQAEKMASLGTLTAGFAHEINNPLNFISGGLQATETLKNELLKIDKNPSPEKLGIYEKMDKIMGSSLEGVQRASDIISSLKFFANPGKAVKKDHKLEDLLFEVLKVVEKKLPYNVVLKREFPTDFVIHCYSEQFQQVLIHVIVNAIEAIEGMNEKSRRSILIKARDCRRQMTETSCITISNNGPNIPEEKIKKVFDPFFSLNSEGRGMGMAISYMIVREHQGWIEARNENKGVAFDVYLPRV